ncbi:SpoIIE family protein phosphatase [Actinomadura parmotrematis]|uniref:histidine kinase n=1 Tax=Actinomadura parmotrematis TaxID=2864039 RepID=A0ABS7FUQ6_9ACTN|nr:SpoIIE family protein phosphatase [Actinomadura parmotrematis]MBW8484144.1 SpoIIE family protein phosphatase [Actinomadura parmotrematis]
MGGAEPAGLLFPGSGEMSARMREHPWGDTPMGAPDAWPASLRTAVRICLTSRFPMIVWWGPELRFLYNDAYLPLLGTNHPALGKPGERVWTEIWHIIGPMLESVMATGEATWSEDLLLPLIRHGYLEETYWTYSYSPLHDDDGAVRGVFTAVSDTTERVIGERRLAVLQDLGAQAGNARSVAEACGLVAEVLARAGRDVPFGAVYLRRPDGDGFELAATGDPDAGAAAFVQGAAGWPVEEAVRTGEPVTVADVRDRFPPLPAGGWESPPAEAVVLPLAGETGAEPIGAVVLAATAGRTLDDAYASFLALVARQIAALVNAAIAYQDQQRRAEELAELDRAKTAFFSNISHEFRTPLTLIMGPLQELRASLGDADERTRTELDVVHRNGLRLGKLVNTLLDFSRIEAGRMQAAYEPVDLAAVTADLASVFRSAVDRAGLAFEVDCPPLPEPVYIDRGMWEKVVLNLLSNALKFTFDGAIRVRVRARDGHAVVTVADTGVGVPEHEIPRLFERFHRIENARSRSNEGSGIGLALVQELVGLHGGTITAASRPGEGTAFTIALPFGAAHLPAASIVPAGSGEALPAGADPYVQEALRWLPDGAQPEPAYGGEVQAAGPALAARVLIADDNADMRQYLARLLEAAGYEVTAVTDGRAALDAVRADPPDLVVSDVMMPRMSGLQLVAALRGDRRTAGTPVLLLSARAGQEASIEGLEAGADDYLVKPFSAAELLARVRANVQLARLRNHHARWRTALVDSLQEAFFVVDADGSVIEINAAFADILGYGPEGLPYAFRHPWWPDPDADPEGFALFTQVYERLLETGKGSFTYPARHRDGHQVWLAASFNPVTDPDTGATLVVGTFRDVTADHYAVQRETATAALSLRLSEAGSLADALTGALGELRGLWNARRVVAALFTPDGAEPAVTATGPDAVGWDGLDPALRAELTALRDRPPLSPAGTGVTLEHPGGLLAVHIEPHRGRPFTEEDRTLLALLSGRLAQGLHRVHQIDQQRETALTLQRAILGPADLPDGFAVRYEPATPPLEVGGDWYDTVRLPDGRIGIVVGDCVGRGLAAATVMGQLRSACRALLIQDARPSAALVALDHFAASIPGAFCSTVFCGVLDPATGELTYSSAGHPPGILTHPDGTVLMLDQARALPLAARPGRPRPEATCSMPPRGTLLLYTDGLVERRRRPLSAGIDQAGAAVQAGRTAPLDELAGQIMARLAPEEGYDDDVALLIYRHPAPLDVAFPAESGQLAPVRSALRDWLGACGLAPRQIQSVLVAAGEACANAIEHGYRDSPGSTVRMRVSATADDLYLAVEDSGTWRPPRPEENAHRGRGLPLMRAMMNRVTVLHEATGTTVDMHTRIGS